MDVGSLWGGVNADFFNLLLVYLIGRYLRLNPCSPLMEHCVRNFFVCVVINFCISFVLGYSGYGKLNLLFEGNNNPITALAAISLFYTFLKMKNVVWINKKVSILASSMLAVYVLHELARTEGLLDFKIFHGDILFVVPVACGVVLSICFIEKVREFLTRPLTDMINKIIKE